MIGALVLSTLIFSNLAHGSFTDKLAYDSFRFFIEKANPKTGLVLDRSHVNGGLALNPTLPITRETGVVASSAATGFGLTAICIGKERGWVTNEYARTFTGRTLKFLLQRAPTVRGWYYHWMDARDGSRIWDSEISSIDTGLLLAGVLTAKQCFQNDLEIQKMAADIYNRVDFKWMLAGDKFLLSHGWKPESGFLPYRWDTYSEHMLLYLLAIGSKSHSISPESWYAWRRNFMNYRGYYYVAGAPPLFIHQFSHAWVDFRNRREKRGSKIQWFENSVTATFAHRKFCNTLHGDFPNSYNENLWGISASDSQFGYMAWGGPPRDPNIDGTVVPNAVAGSAMFLPQQSIATLEYIFNNFGPKVYGRYGFVDAFNPTTDWNDSDVIGIDVGITLLSIENHQSETVWKYFMRNPEIISALNLIELN